MHRRKYLATSAAFTTGILAGCSIPGGGGEEDGEEDGQEGGDEEEGGEGRLAEPK